MNPEIVNILNEFREKLDNIEKDISKMRVLIFELSDGKYNPFGDENSLAHSESDAMRPTRSNSHNGNHGIASTETADAKISVTSLMAVDRLDRGAEAERTELAELLEKNQEKLNDFHDKLEEIHVGSQQTKNMNAELNLENAEVALIQRFAAKQSTDLDRYLSHIGQSAWSGKTDPFGNLNRLRGNQKLDQSGWMIQTKRGSLL